MKDGETITNEHGAKQSFVSARMDLIPPECLLLMGECYGYGGRKYGDHNWKNIPIEDHINHTLIHLLKWQAGDRREPHLVNACVRASFALFKAIQSDEQPLRYIHPEMENGNSHKDDEEESTRKTDEELFRQITQKNANPKTTVTHKIT